MREFANLVLKDTNIFIDEKINMLETFLNQTNSHLNRLERKVSFSDESIEKFKEYISWLESKINELKKQVSICEHDYQTVAVYGSHIVRCNKCGYETGA